MRPETGGRFSARLLEDDAASARFDVELATPDSIWSTRAQVTCSDGGVSFEPWGDAGEPPEWLTRYTHAALRAAWRQHAALGWPRRLTRWRDKPGSEEGGREGGAG
jgi:hypothetical protein